MRKKVKIDFFRVHVSGAKITLEAIMDKVHALPEVKDRNVYWSGSPTRLLTLGSTREVREGAMEKIRMTDLPKKAKTDGPSTELDLDDDEGLGEETAFLFHIPTGVLALLRNRASVSPGAFANYYSSFGACQIDLEHILREDALQRILGKGIYRKLELKLAGLEDIPDLGKADLTTSGAAAMTRQLKSPSLEIIASMDRKSGSLSVRAIKSVIESVRGIWAKHPDAVRRIRVSGQENEDSPTEAIDLLEFTVREEVEISMDDGARSVPTGLLVGAVNDAWKRQRDYLRSIYPEK